MTKSNLLFGAAIALAAGMLAGCSKEPAAENQIQTVDHDQQRYLNVSILSPKGTNTRASDGDFNEGDPKENTVADMYFVFYDKDGNPTGETTHIETPTFNADNTRPSVNSIYSSVVPIQLKQGDNLPAYVMCFLNPISTADFATSTLEEMEGITRKAIIVSKNGIEYFPMSNSVYYGTDPNTGETNKRMIATPIRTDQLYSTQKDAEDALKDGETTDIYVERYAARIKVTLEAANIKEVTTNNKDIVGVNGYTLKFIPKAWRPNAIDQELYAVKRFGIINGTTPDFNPSYATIADKLVGSETDSWWNDRDNFRSYWACSPSYYDNDYPRVSDDITDEVANNAHTTDYPYSLHYFNYKQIIDNTTGSTDNYAFTNSIEWKDGAFADIFYARETTTSVTAWQGENKIYNPLASLASAVIVGHYELTANTGSPAVPAPADGKEYPTFYLFGKTDGNWNLYFEDSIEEAMMKNQNIVYKRENNVYIPADDPALFKVEHPSEAVRTAGDVIVAGRLVGLQLDRVPATGETYYFYNTKTSSYEAIAEANINTVNANLLSVGYARKYGDGLCYFNIPIEHLGIYATSSGDTGTRVTNAKNADGTYNFENCPAGSFGIVRNHAYNINITSITGLATALSSETQPIVPPVNETEYHVAARVNILNWRIVPTQSVTL